MDINFQEQTIHFYREALQEAIYQEETAELTLPESLPEADRIISSSGEICLKSKEIGSGTVTVNGEVKAVVLFADADNCLHRAEREIPFTVKKEITGLETGHFAQYVGWIKRVDARLLGSRKMLFRVNIGSRIAALLPSSISVNTLPEAPKTLQTLQKTYDFMLPSLFGEKEVRFNEECDLPQTATGISEILRSSVKFRQTETKTVGDKAVFKGDILLHILYRSSAGTVHVFDTALPFSQYTELNGETENGEVQLALQLQSCDTETDGQEDSRHLYVNISALAQSVISTNHRLILTEDAYATRGELETEWEDINLQARLDAQDTALCAEVSVPASAQQVLDAAVYEDTPLIRRDGTAVKAVLPLHADVIFIDKDGIVQGRETRGELVMETAAAESAVFRAQGAVLEPPVSLASYDTVTLRVTAQLKLESYMGSRLHTLKTAKMIGTDEISADRPSLIAKRVDVASVWEIAKSCKSTVDAICEANGLTAGVAQEGAILLIPIQ